MHFQRLIQTEADLMRLEEVHSSLFNEHKNLQEDYERIHIYVEVSFFLPCKFIKSQHFWTTTYPPLVNVVKECPLLESRKTVQ